jgi:hypothetical protein
MKLKSETGCFTTLNIIFVRLCLCGSLFLLFLNIFFQEVDLTFFPKVVLLVFEKKNKKIKCHVSKVGQELYNNYFSKSKAVCYKSFY